MKTIIISDSSSDLLQFGGAEYKSVPLKIITDVREYTDDENLDLDGMIADLKKYKGKSKTSCPNVEDWLSAMQGYDRVFCVTITSGLSGSNNSANLAMRDYLEQNPDKEGYVIDTLSTGPESALIIEKLAEFINGGLDFDEIKTEIEKYRKHTHLTFCLESLRNLANNGRVNAAVAKIAGILGIRIVGVASREGTLEISEKARGGEKALSAIIKNILGNGYIGGKIRIHHCQALETAKAIRNAIMELFPKAELIIAKTAALCSFYAESGGVLIGYEGAEKC